MRETGRVKFYSEKGFGFITDDETEKDIFFHFSSFPKGTIINEGDSVEYEIEEAEKGPKAVKIVILEE